MHEAGLRPPSLDSLRGAGYEVGISHDKPEKLAKFRERDALTLTLLSDPGKEVMQAWGAFGEEEALRQGGRGRHPLDLVVDEEGKVEVAQWHVKATGHVAKLPQGPRPRHLTVHHGSTASRPGVPHRLTPARS